MISFEEAYRRVISLKLSLGSERISLMDGVGRTLDESWFADRDLPPYDRVAMDGIAVNYIAIEKMDAPLVIEGTAAAGSPKMTLSNKQNCLEVMTGAVLPEGTDTVIRYEDLTIEANQCRIDATFKIGQNIHRRASDRMTGDCLVNKGKKLSSAEIGVGASIGRDQIIVKKRPRIALISTGNELVEIDEVPQAHQIRRSNIYQIRCILKSIGMEAESFHVRDQYEEIVNKLKLLIENFDILVLSGGVSKGKFDFIPKALQQLGVQKHFHRVAQRPGKPFWLGQHSSGVVVFALPGNPVSSFMCTCVYLAPWLKRVASGAELDMPYAVLQSKFKFRPDLTYFLPVKLVCSSDGSLHAFAKKGGGSGDLANLLEADGFIQLPSDKSIFLPGESYPVFIFRS